MITTSRHVIRHFVYTRWDRWTACGLPKATQSRARRTTSIVERITCVECLRVVGA